MKSPSTLAGRIPVKSPSALGICFDRFLPADREPEAIAYAIQQNSANQLVFSGGPSPAPRMAIESGKKWGLPPDGSPVVLRCRFLGGSPSVQNNVITHARRLEQHANVRFEFTASGTTNIRIGFDAGSGSWSYIGTDCDMLSQNVKTMNFGWFNANTTYEDYSATVQHEFMHSLGALHEHQSPGATIRWNEPAVYEVYGGPPNYWDRATTKSNVIDKYGQAGIENTEFDPKSIMLYPIDPKLTLDNFGSEWNTDLSTRDRAFLSIQYPRPDTTPPVEPPVVPPPVEPPVVPPVVPPSGYRILTVGGEPMIGELRSVNPEVFKMTIAETARYAIIGRRVGIPGSVYVEAHKGAYPSKTVTKKTNSIRGPINAGVFYVTVLPLRPVQSRGLFSLTCRRTGHA